MPKAVNAATPRGNLTIRVRDEVRRGLEASAAESGRSLSEEAEHRLEASFRDDRIEARLDEIVSLIKPVRRIA
jgi:hypothetical protein